MYFLLIIEEFIQFLLRHDCNIVILVSPKDGLLFYILLWLVLSNEDYVSVLREFIYRFCS